MDNKNINPIFFIGPGKSGTTFLYNLMKDNSLNLGKIKKSNHFFKKKPLERYLNEYKENRIIDFSNIYFWNPNIGLKIIDYFPNAIIIVIKRNPYSRLASHINYLYSRGEIIGDWKEYLKNNRDLFLSIDFDFYRGRWKNLFRENYIELDFNKISDINYLNQELGRFIPPMKNTNPNKYSTYPTKGNKILSLFFSTLLAR